MPITAITTNISMRVNATPGLKSAPSNLKYFRTITSIASFWNSPEDILQLRISRIESQCQFCHKEGVGIAFLVHQKGGVIIRYLGGTRTERDALAEREVSFLFEALAFHFAGWSVLRWCWSTQLRHTRSPDVKSGNRNAQFAQPLLRPIVSREFRIAFEATQVVLEIDSL